MEIAKVQIDNILCSGLLPTFYLFIHRTSKTSRWQAVNRRRRESSSSVLVLLVSRFLSSREEGSSKDESGGKQCFIRLKSSAFQVDETGLTY